MNAIEEFKNNRQQNDTTQVVKGKVFTIPKEEEAGPVGPKYYEGPKEHYFIQPKKSKRTRYELVTRKGSGNNKHEFIVPEGDLSNYQRYPLRAIYENPDIQQNDTLYYLNQRDLMHNQYMTPSHPMYQQFKNRESFQEKQNFNKNYFNKFYEQYLNQ